MALKQTKSGRTKTGSVNTARRRFRKHLNAHRGSPPVDTRFDEKGEEDVTKTVRTMGGNFKIKAKRVVFVNLSDGKGKVQKTKIEDVVANPANKHFVRRKVLTKGALIKTSLGEATVTSRPGQIGVVNAVLNQK